ncbi:uncharacterized protein K441DRAFT_665738, partial [Cenococcum geophilum 1.58]|uniref:uncharacterized protein n=1 Tax=Cenococcum geophilum 1.58 TaxID=794803 RepID=UPI00358EC0E1
LKNYIYKFVCPDCSVFRIIVIIIGALFSLVCFVHLLSMLPLALALFWTTGCLLNGVQQLYKARLG